MIKHFVTFLSPGTLIAEQTTKEIEAWDIGKAIEMSADIVERYKARPYGFYFTIRERGPDDLDSKQTHNSHMYFLGGDVLTLEQVKARDDPEDRILISNMESNHFDRIIVNDNSWRWVQALTHDAVVLDI